MNTSYSIPETAKLTGIPEHAIREYAKQFADVLPAPETSEGGRGPVKRYPDAALAIFRSIRKLKDDGFDAAQIRIALHTPRSGDTEETVRDAAVALIGDEAQWAEVAPESLCLEMVEESANTTEAAAEESIEAASEEGVEAVGEEEATIEIEAIAEEEATIEIEAIAEAPTEIEGESVELSGAVEEQALSGEPAEALGEETVTDETAQEAIAETELPIEDSYATEEVVEILEEAIGDASAGTAAFQPLFTNLNDGLKQLRKIMDENTSERETLRTEREALLAQTAAKQAEIEFLTTTVATQAEKIGGLQTALNALMSQCDQQLQAIRSALGHN
jgi:DNA-binding transcriptional MerR regulator